MLDGGGTSKKAYFDGQSQKNAQGTHSRYEKDKCSNKCNQEKGKKIDAQVNITVNSVKIYLIYQDNFFQDQTCFLLQRYMRFARVSKNQNF